MTVAVRVKCREYSSVANHDYLSRRQQAVYNQLNSKLKNYVGNVLLARGGELDIAAARLILNIVERNSDAGNCEGFFLKGLEKLPSTELKSKLETLLCVVKKNFGDAFFKCVYTQENILYDTRILVEILTKFQLVTSHLPDDFPAIYSFPSYLEGGKDILDGFLSNPANRTVLENAHSDTDARIIAKIGDAVRGTLLASKLAQVPTLIDRVNELVIGLGGQIIGFKDFWEEPSELGYVGIHLKVYLPIPNPGNRSQALPNEDFMLGEVQIHLPDVMDGTLTCPKELAHRLYKFQGEGAEPPPEQIAASHLIYLIGVSKLLKSENHPNAAIRPLDDVLKNILDDLVPERAEFVCSALEAVQFLKDNQNLYGEPVWDSRRKAVVPSNHDAVASALRDRAVLVRRWERLNIEGNPQNACHNTAKSVTNLMRDAKRLAPYFEEMCKKAIEDQQPACRVTFGPNNSCLKQKNSLLDKIHKDRQVLLAAVR